MRGGLGERRTGSVTRDDKREGEMDGLITTVDGGEVTSVMSEMTGGGGEDGKVGGWEVVDDWGKVGGGCRNEGVE